MERTKDVAIDLSDEMLSEIEPIIERINGLEELLIIIPNDDYNLRQRAVHELTALNLRKSEWLETVNESQSMDRDVEYSFDFDFLEKTMTIYPSL